MAEEGYSGMCSVCVGEEAFWIGFKYGQDKYMITGQLIIILGYKEEEVKGKEDSNFPTNYHT